MAKLPIRFKLTVWFLAIFASIFLGVSATMWFLGRNAQRRLLDDGLLSLAKGVGTLLVKFEGDFSDLDLRPYQPVDREFSLLAVRDNAGTVLTSDIRVDTAALPPIPEPPAESVIHTIDGDVARRLVGRAIETRMVTHRLVASDGDVFYLDLARTTDVGRRQRLFFSDVLFMAGLGGLLSSTIAAWILLGRATSPILRLAEAARRVGPEGETRLPVDSRGGSSGSEIERLQTALNEALGRLEEGYRVRQQFLANVAHDLKTPVSVMLTQSQVLQPDGANLQEFQAYRQSMVDELRRLRGIIEGILTLSRADQGEGLLRRTALSVNTIVSQCAARARPQAEAANVLVRTTLLERSEQGELNGDLDLLSTMLDNLVRNAIRFSPHHETVDIRADRSDHHVRITVRDRGPGIPDAYVDKIFDRFVQVPTKDGRPGGTGLGLAIAKAVSLAHGGSIEVRNCGDGGCEFALTLPLRG
jgi:signal transduction histidine kinase